MPTVLPADASRILETLLYKLYRERACRERVYEGPEDEVEWERKRKREKERERAGRKLEWRFDLPYKLVNLR